MPQETHQPFSWKKHTAALQKKMELRVERLAVINPDFKIAHPDICSDLAKDSHTLCKKFVKEKIERNSKKSNVPVVQRPMRLNRVV